MIGWEVHHPEGHEDGRLDGLAAAEVVDLGINIRLRWLRKPIQSFESM